MLFGKRGYGAVGTEQVVKRARVTRGALYHHFDDKRDLFRAVYEQVETELTEQIGAELIARAQDDPVAALIEGMEMVLDLSLDPELRQITLVDAPAVLGWSEWRTLGDQYGLGLTTAGLEIGMEAGQLRRQPARPLAHVLLAAMSEAALMVANADDAVATRAEAEGALRSIVEGLRA
jgi:AcrR family transcriptional regulator